MVGKSTDERVTVLQLRFPSSGALENFVSRFAQSGTERKKQGADGARDDQGR